MFPTLLFYQFLYRGGFSLKTHSSHLKKCKQSHGVAAQALIGQDRCYVLVGVVCGGQDIRPHLNVN